MGSSLAKQFYVYLFYYLLTYLLTLLLTYLLTYLLTHLLTYLLTCYTCIFTIPMGSIPYVWRSAGEAIADSRCLHLKSHMV